MNKTTRNNDTKVKSKKNVVKTAAEKHAASTSSRDVQAKTKSSTGAAKTAAGKHAASTSSRHVQAKTKSSTGAAKTAAGKHAASTSFRDAKAKSKSSTGIVKPVTFYDENSVDYAIKNKHIFKTMTKVPTKVLTVLYKNYWIWKRLTEHRRKTKRIPKVMSRHKNAERVKNVAQRYDPGLILTDMYKGGVKWLSLKRDVMVNRFPRDGYARLKLCNNALAGKSEYNGFFPRTYSAQPRNRNVLATADNCFEGDFSLTACVSLMRAFVDTNNRNIAKCSKKFGTVPLSALHFAINTCSEYVAPRKPQGPDLSGEGKKWDEFFAHFHRVMDDYEMFVAPPSDDMLGLLKTFCEQLIEQVSKIRPQSVIDGHNNLWVVKTEQPATGNDATVVLNRFSDIMKRCTTKQTSIGCSRGGCQSVVQKYIETPMLNDRYKFDVQTWLLVSTLDKCLTVWLHDKCCTQTSLHRYKTSLEPNEFVHLVNSKVNRPSAIFRETKACGLKFLKAKLRSIKSRGSRPPSAKDGGKQHVPAVYSAIRDSVITSVLAAATGGVLHTRPNCIEIFQATYTVSHDRRPWLIDIKSDPYETHAFHVNSTTIHKSVPLGLIKIVVAKNRANRINVGSFEAVYRGPIPGEYKPRAFVEKPRPRLRRHKNWPRGTGIELLDDNYVETNFMDEYVSTYIEKIHPDDVEDPENPTIPIGAKSPEVRELMQTLDRKPPSMDELRESLALLRTGTTIDQKQANHCLRLLEEWKTRVKSAQRFYSAVGSNGGDVKQP